MSQTIIVTLLKSISDAVNGVIGSAPAVASNFRLLSAANTDNPNVIKATPGTLYKLKGVNHAAATRYIKLYDKATAPASSDTPKETIEIPASNAFELDWTSKGAAFAAGIAFRITGAQPDNDNTAVTAGDLTSLNFGYA